jgi:cytosine/adenosine deaminase-related metal-dependent hydrolase
MKLTGARVAVDAMTATRMDLTVARSRILPFGTPSPDPVEYDLSGHLLLPGLINAHDHLEFNLFPRLGVGPWPNATSWAADIYSPGRSPIKEHLALSRRARLLWGGLKNLLSGVTTVAHHNGYSPEVFEHGFPVRVVRRYGWAHSIDFSPDFRERFDRTPARWPFIMHAAEGTDEHAHSEVRRIESAGALTRRTVLVHAVALKADDIALLRRRKASIVWCPTSNLFTLGRSLSTEVLRSGIRIALGSDSALTAEGDLRDEMRAARRQGMDTREIYELVTRRAADVLKLGWGHGVIRERGSADVVAVMDSGGPPTEALQTLNPALVMVGGSVKLLAKHVSVMNRKTSNPLRHTLAVEGEGNWFVDVDVSALHKETVRALGPEYRLAGKRVCA